MSKPTEEELRTLFAKAVDAKEHAYCPYSKFRVGACLLTESGEFVSGSNVECASFPVGACAEKSAICTAVSSGKRKYRAIAVSSDISPPASPCGNCRQFIYSIREFVSPEFPIYMVDKDGQSIMMTMEQILPGSFGPESMPQEAMN
ncbi:hypothetical protein KEM52_005966 [Ascosphaera acerosa]|nr:hypothetical protein KEM52_005966 [Ascosphaera acerosa]